MLNRSPRDSTSILEAEPGKLDMKRHSPIILFIYVSKLQLHFTNTFNNELKTRLTSALLENM